jgi:hypothetical protein
MADTIQMGNDALAPMLNAIRSYGQQLAEERRIKEQRDYQSAVRNEERDYMKGVREEERAYAEARARRIREEGFQDEARRRRTENERKVLQAYPGLNVQEMSDAQLESKALEATRKITFDDTMAKSDAQIRTEAQNYGVKDFATADITSLRKLVSDAKVKEAIDAETEKRKAGEAYEDQRLTTGDGAAAAQAYASLANQRADLLREFAILSKQPDDKPVDKVAIGRRAVQLMSGADPLSSSPDDMEIGSKLFAMMNDPKNRDMKALILDPILRGEAPSNDAISRLIPDPMHQMYLLGLNARALRDVNAIDPKMLQAEAAVNRNSVYSQKFLLGDRLAMLDSSMRQLTDAYPSLKKRPNVNLERLTAPSNPGDPTKIRSGSALLPLPVSSPSQPITQEPDRLTASARKPIQYPPMPPGFYQEDQAPEAQLIGPNQPAVNMPLSPVEQFYREAKRLGALEGRGGAYTYGAQSSLMTPFYESVAGTLGVQPQQVGSSIFYKNPRSIVADKFPQQQFDQLPDNVKNQIYIDALNRASSAPAPKYDWLGRSPYQGTILPFLDWSVNRE